jgi:hypothetical protein
MFRDLIVKSEAHIYSMNRAEDLIRGALKTLSGLGMKASYRSVLEDLVSSVFSGTDELKELLLG